MSGLRTDSIPLFNEVNADGDSPPASIQNSEGVTFLVKGTAIGEPVTVELITFDPNGNEYLLNTDTLTPTKETVTPVLLGGQYVDLICRLTGITAGTYSAFLNVKREV